MTTYLVTSALFAMTFFASAGQTPATPQKIVRVFVETNDQGDPAEVADRRTSVKDLAAALGSKRKAFTVVEDVDKAHLSIEVIERAYNVPKVVFGLGARPGQSTIGAAPVRTAELRVRVTAVPGELAVNLKNKNRAADNPRGWKSAAGDLADQIEKWVFDHRDLFRG
jgi:hypothetical protein